MARKRSFPSLADAMAELMKPPRIGASQGRGPRTDHGARQAAIGTPNPAFSGAVSAQSDGVFHDGNPPAVPGGSPGSDRADDR